METPVFAAHYGPHPEEALEITESTELSSEKLVMCCTIVALDAKFTILLTVYWLHSQLDEPLFSVKTVPIGSIAYEVTWGKGGKDHVLPVFCTILRAKSEYHLLNRRMSWSAWEN
ncbi:hypothetical protein OSTOST_19527 [Ostertagia ostertagi]